MIRVQWQAERNEEIAARVSSGATLRALAAEYGLSFERIRQIDNAVRRRNGEDGDEPKPKDGDAPQGFDEKAWRRNYMRLYMRRRREREREKKEGDR